MRVIVVIPFRGDAGLLRWTLEGYAAQRCAGIDMEVRVGGDGVAAPGLGALDTTRDDEGEGELAWVVKSFPRMGAGAVRNALLQDAEGDVVIFGNADARPQPGMVRAHVNRLKSLVMEGKEGMMVLGAAPWEAPSGGGTVFDALLAETPMVFFYEALRAGEFYDFRQAWTLNLSVRLGDFRRSGGFIEAIRPVYYEDLAWGHKLLGERRGVYYEPAARVVHRHPTTLEQYLDREELLGLMAPVVARHAPETFAALFGESVEELAAEFKAWVAMDGAMHRYIYERLVEWAGRAVGDLTRGEERKRVLMTIYQMHVPLKRLAFRLGFLRGLEMGDERWEERRAVGMWRGMANGE